LDHRQPDRIPVDFGGTFVSGIHVSCVLALRDYFGLEKKPVKVIDPGSSWAKSRKISNWRWASTRRASSGA
jgi:hypothetical protein